MPLLAIFQITRFLSLKLNQSKSSRKKLLLLNLKVHKVQQIQERLNKRLIQKQPRLPTKQPLMASLVKILHSQSKRVKEPLFKRIHLMKQTLLLVQEIKLDQNKLQRFSQMLMLLKEN
jgi:hypothetical protein